MKTHKKLFPKLFWLGAMGLGAALFGAEPSCKAQEVNPTRFTATGVEDEYAVQKPQMKKTILAKTSTQAMTRISSLTVAASQAENNGQTAMRRNVISTDRVQVKKGNAKHPAGRVSVKERSEIPME
jgi:hypothetical protein